jgi:hypothetical protein
MDDKAFTEHGLKLSICPTQARWPEPKVLHWQALHRCADEARDRVAQAWAAISEIDADKDLSSEGKARRRKKVTDETIADFERSKTLISAKDAVERQVAKWEEQTGMTVKPPTNVAEAVVYSEIRAHLAAMKGSKLGFVEQHVSDPRVASAVLGAPPFLSGLSQTEVAMVKNKVEQHVAPGIAEARDATLKAMQQAEHGWERAMAKIGERGSLTKGPDGAWRDPKVPEPAAA